MEIEQWYDEQMDRVSGWYKRHVRWISVIIGVVVVLAFNLNTVTIARSLYADEALRGSVVAQATAAAECGTKEPADCIVELRKEISGVRSAGLPVGWVVVPACAGSETKLSTCSWPEALGLADPASDGGADQTFFLVLLVGWALMVLALLPGARFWFDALSRLGSLRASGPKPNRAPAARDA